MTPCAVPCTRARPEKTPTPLWKMGLSRFALGVKYVSSAFGLRSSEKHVAGFFSAASRSRGFFLLCHTTTVVALTFLSRRCHLFESRFFQLP